METIGNGKLLIINEKETEALLDMPTAIADVETALKEYAEGLCVNPVKLHLPIYPTYQGYLNSMPAFLKKHNVMGAKLVSVYKENARKYNLPTTLGMIALQHPETGMPFAVIDGTSITSIRTGAAAGVAAKYLANSDAHVLLQVGVGIQGITTVKAVMTGFSGIDEIRGADINPDNLKRFEKIVNEEYPGVKVRLYENYKDAIHGASVCSFATTTARSLSRQVSFDKGTVVLLVSDPVDNNDLLRFDKRVVDFPECYCVRINQKLRNGADKEYAEIVPETFTSTLGDVILGKQKGRDNADDIIAVGMIGMGVEDLMVALTVFNRAMERGIGTEVSFIDC